MYTSLCLVLTFEHTNVPGIGYSKILTYQHSSEIGSLSKLSCQPCPDIGSKANFYMVWGRYKPGIKIGIMQGMYLVLHHVPTTTTYQALVRMEAIPIPVWYGSLYECQSEAHGPKCIVYTNCVVLIIYREQPWCIVLVCILVWSMDLR